MSLVQPHGGVLINRLLSTEAAQKATAAANSLVPVRLSPREQGDWELLTVGGFSPLKGFMGQKDFARVCNEMRLADGTVWPIPVILSPADDVTAKVNVGDTIALLDSEDALLGTMKVTEKYPHDKALENKVYGTDDAKHPGIAVTAKQGSFCLAGEIDAVSANNDPEFADHRLTPAQTRQAFDDKGWATVAAFQTRNPIHRSHEYLTKCALGDDRRPFDPPRRRRDESRRHPRQNTNGLLHHADRQLLHRPHDAQRPAAGDAVCRPA